jgi:dihydrofolate reductase
MRKIVFSLAVSLDGFFEGPNHEIDWSLVDDELLAHMNDQFRDASAFLTGRITHELMLRTWPAVAADPDATPLMADFASIWVPKPKYVFSRTIDHTEANATVRPEVVAEEIRELQRQPGGDMVVGGPELARTFRELDLIDEYWVYVHPVLIGRGRPMFQPTDARSSLSLASVRTFGNGVVRMGYAR